MLAVLRRPQTEADIDPELLRLIKPPPPYPAWLQRTPDVPLMRRVLTIWGEKLYLIPMKPESVSELRAAWAQHRRHLPLSRFIAAHDVETLALYTSNGGGGGEATAGSIQYVGSDAFQGWRVAGLKPGQGGYQYLIRVVPDGVTKVVFVVRGHLGPRTPDTPANPPPTKVTAIVHDNIAAARIRRQAPAGSFEAIWYDKNGHILKRSFWP
jgi:hypothetical protein